MKKTIDSENYQRQFAFLSLWHPITPDPFPSLRLMENHLKDLLAWSDARTAVNYHGSVLLRIMFILDLQNATLEAQ